MVLTDDDLAAIERGAPFAAPGYDEDIFALVAEVRWLRARIAQLEHADPLDVFTEGGA